MGQDIQPCFIMEDGYLRSLSLHAAEDAKKTDLTRVKTLKRHLMKTLKRQKTVIGTTTKDCTNEFHFVKFDTIQRIKESGSQVMDKEYAWKDMEKWTSDKDDKFDSNVKTIKTKKGVIWQQTGNFFSTWHERFFVLTENSLYSFPKGCKATETLAAATKIRLSELSDVKLMNQKGQMVLKLQSSKKSVAHLRKPEGLKDWYENILDNIHLLKMKKMESSMYRSLVSDSQFEQKPCSSPAISRPCMGVSSLTYKKQFLP